MNDKPLYQATEADKWFERYLSAIKQRDEARAEVERLREALDTYAQLPTNGLAPASGALALKALGRFP